jgi:hypothetical protein
MQRCSLQTLTTWLCESLPETVVREPFGAFPVWRQVTRQPRICCEWRAPSQSGKASLPKQNCALMRRLVACCPRCERPHSNEACGLHLPKCSLLARWLERGVQRRSSGSILACSGHLWRDWWRFGGNRPVPPSHETALQLPAPASYCNIIWRRRCRELRLCAFSRVEERSHLLYRSLAPDL